MPAVKVLVSQIALMVSALKSRRGTGLGVTASIAEMVEVSTAPRNQPMNFTAMARIVCAINV